MYNVNMRPNYVIIDFETTGLDAKVEQVTEVAAIRCDADLNVIESFQTYVKLGEGRTLSDFIKNLTGFTDEFLNENGIPEGEAIKGLWDFIHKNENGFEPVVVAHHVPFDFAYIANYGLYPREFICTRVLSRLIEPNEKASLADVAKRHGFYDAENHHKASSDTEMTRQLLLKFLPMAEDRRIGYRNLVIDSSERPLTYIPAYAVVQKI